MLKTHDVWVIFQEGYLSQLTEAIKATWMLWDSKKNLNFNLEQAELLSQISNSEDY